MKKVVLLLLLLAACQFIPQTMQPAPAFVSTGTSALEITSNPISTNEIFMCQQGELLFDLKNQGIAGINKGRLSLIVEDQYIQSVDSRQRTFSLGGKTAYNPRGDFDQVSFRIENSGLPSMFETHDTVAILQACYAYKTFAAVPVCIDPDVYDLDPRKPCKPQPVTSPGGQGAPVSVTKVVALMSPVGDKVMPVFSIYVQHQGRGAVVTPEGVDIACAATGEIKQELLSQPIISASIQDVDLVCLPEKVFLIPGKESLVVCQNNKLLFDKSTGTFSALLSVELDYGYVNTVAHPLRIVRLPGQAGC